MANVMKELKAEISRIARSEIKSALSPIKSVNAAQRKYIADLRRQLGDLEKENKQLARQLEKLGAAVPQPEPEEDAGRAWITAAGIRSMRKRLKLSQKAFAELAGVSLPTVANWESSKNKGNKLNIRRKEVFDRLQEIKGMGVRDLPQE
ncbi:helix-turn-helix domain-containing protein [Tichowtungia aerotolerans]|uniref:Helix-turn-helix domain-containing protein n=1 Tax=Tichowtungia aerotolerans TaxID=2697043 RepID=A0A6P1M5B3_9BACT|nr:helix-turn-helix domain-containing protein [Tichowtungia aerotolerans]QHI68183.1 helix-turn-helix domain-containing protein [Tichowtungia aerotolerans]